jgi:hypothetical protein
VSPDGKSVRGDRFPVADAFEERVAGDDVFVFTCSVVIRIIVRFKEEEQKRSQRTNPRHHPREERLQRTRIREIESKNERTSIDNYHVPVMVTVLVLLCFEENFVKGTTLSPEPTFVACWFRACCCSLPPPVPPPEVVFIFSFFFSRSRNEKLTQRQKKKTDTKKQFRVYTIP